MKSARAIATQASELQRFRRWLVLSDLMVTTWALLGAHLLRFGPEFRELQGRALLENRYTLISILVVISWMVTLAIYGAYDIGQFGHGPEEYRDLARATLVLFAGMAMVSYILKLEVARGYVLIALPLGLIGLTLTRWLWRRWLAHQREQGKLCRDVIIVGHRAHLESLVAALRRAPAAGYRIVAACTSADTTEVAGVPVIGSEAEAGVLARRYRPDAVICGSSAHLGPMGLRSLGWSLEGSGIDLLVVPGLTDIAGPRVITRPVAGLPMLEVDPPVFTGPKLVFKTAIDLAGGIALVLLASPVLLVVGALIKLHDRGPVFFFQERVGINGRSFRMVKFRSMVVDAEDRLAQVIAETEPGADGVDRGVLFKAENDPRITPIGRFIRRFSIDELPQLFNVIGGQMSLVGPRPPLPREVALYGDDVRRRLLVKPGMTGLWQVSGRSDLSWEESVRFDLYYVENWSVLGDLMILWRTVRAVLTARGAY